MVGKSGCGKSSIISLIERFYDPTEGSILFSGVDIKDIDPQFYKTLISQVAQEPILFSGTIKENILYGVDVEGLDKDRVNDLLDEACKKSNAYDFVHDKSMFPEGYETLVGEKGIKLSGG